MARGVVATDARRDCDRRDFDSSLALSAATLCAGVVDFLLGTIVDHVDVAHAALVKGEHSPMSSLTIIESILRDRQAFFAEIRQGQDLKEKMRAMLISSIAFLALYGAVMGSTHSLWQALS